MKWEIILVLIDKYISIYLETDSYTASVLWLWKYLIDLSNTLQNSVYYIYE